MSTKRNAPLDLELYQLEELEQAALRAEMENSCLYSYKSSGHQNWLERGLFASDALGIVVLPQGLPDVISLQNGPQHIERHFRLLLMSTGH